MKKWILAIFAVFYLSVFYAAEPEKVEMLSSKVILQNNNGYFVLSDGSLWKVIHFVRRWRTPIEWWNDIQLVPENYECLPNDWYLGSEIEVYSKYDNLQVYETDASNQEILKRCTHLFVNTRTNHVLFAIALDPEDCIIQLFNDARKDGYKEGYAEGCLESSQNKKDIYDSGYSDGYKDGYRDGVREAG